MKLNTYVNFAGQCAQAFRFYEAHLGATIGMMMTHGQAPDPSKVNPDWKDLVLHARLTIAGTELLDTFFASRFGQLRDRFGINWMILHERPMPSRT